MPQRVNNLRLVPSTPCIPTLGSPPLQASREGWQAVRECMRSELTANRIGLGVLAVALVACPSAALAQYAVPVPPPIYMWSGGYVGLNAGVAGGADAISEA